MKYTLALLLTFSGVAYGFREYLGFDQSDSVSGLFTLVIFVVFFLLLERYQKRKKKKDDWRDK